MQSHAPPRRKSSAGVIITIFLVLGFFFFGALVLLGVGAFVFARADTQRAHAMAARDMARSQAEMARAEMQQKLEMSERQLEQAHEQSMRAHDMAVAEREDEPIRVANREITLLLDKAGKIKLDGKPIDKAKLEDALKNIGKGRESALAVTIKADRDCKFAHVAEALEVCQKLDLHNVKISAVK